MVAFTIMNWPIYWYGLLYLISFILGYIYFVWISKQARMEKWPKVKDLLSHNLDNLMIAVILGVMIGGRLGDVLLYNWSYYSQHLDQIWALRNGGMSFVGWIIGVVIAVGIIKYIYKLSRTDLMVLLDCIVLFLPIGILLWRIGNSLNQELYGKVFNSQLWNSQFSIAKYLHNWELLNNLKLIRIYENVDNQRRRNTNLLEGFFEGLFLFLLQIVVFWKKLVKWLLKPWMISWFFAIVYAVVRFFLETLRDNPPSEYWHGILKSQILMIALVILWVIVIIISTKSTSKFDKIN